jgi:mono/diheme cytochrome c family protein
MPAITKDRFALAVEDAGSGLDVEAARSALEGAGAGSIEVVPAAEPLGPVSSQFLTRSAVAVVAVSAIAGYATYWTGKLFPVLPPMVHIQEQPRVNPYEESSFFEDGFAMRPPVPGTVARGHLPYPFGTQEKAASLPNPLPRTKEVLSRGEKVYETHCVVCHGALGDGVPTLTSAYGAKPANLQSKTYREGYPDGMMYHVIVAGKNSMPGYAAEIPEDDRWATIHYVRALQRAQNATDADIEEALKE